MDTVFEIIETIQRAKVNNYTKEEWKEKFVVDLLKYTSPKVEDIPKRVHEYEELADFLVSEFWFLND